MKLMIILAALLMAGCLSRGPGGRSDVLMTDQYVEDEMYWQAVGIRF